MIDAGISATSNVETRRDRDTHALQSIRVLLQTGRSGEGGGLPLGLVSPGRKTATCVARSALSRWCDACN